MTKLKTARLIATVVTGLTFASGMGVAGASPHDNHDHNNGGVHVSAHNDVNVDNTTTQNAQTGAATVNSGSQDKERHHDEHNSSGGNSATSGGASNSNSASIGVTVSNTMPAPQNSGEEDHHSNTNVDASVHNDVDVNNTTTQNAQSGDATVNGGSNNSATSGNASNSNSTTITVGVSNN